MGGTNTYGYVGGNPLIFKDPYGLEKWFGGIGGSIPFIGGFELNIFATDGEGDLGCNPDLGVSFSVAEPIEGGALEKGIGKLKLGPQLGYEWNGGRGGFIEVDAEIIAGANGLGLGVTGLNSGNYGILIEGGVPIALGANKTVDFSISVGDLGRLAAAIWNWDFSQQIFGVEQGSNCGCGNQ